MRGYIYLIASILFEIAGSAFLKMSEGFTVLIPSLALIVFYFLSFTFLVLAMKTVSLSIGYSIWAGLGTAGAAIVGATFFQEQLSGLNIFGLVVIIVGVVLMNASRKEEESPVI